MSKNCKNCKQTVNSLRYKLEDPYGIKADALLCSKINAFVPAESVKDCFDQNILPCPFCGGVGEIGHSGVDTVYIFCRGCNATGPKGYSTEAFPAWNKRV